MHVDLDLVIGTFAHVDAGDLGRVEGALDQQLGIGRPLEHVDVLIAQLADDADDAGPLDTDAGADRIDAVVVGFDGHLGTFTRDADDFLDGDQSVIDFRDLLLEELDQEFVGRAGQGDVGSGVVLHLHALDDRADGLVLLETFARNLLVLGQAELVAVLIEDEHFLGPGLVDFAGEDVTDLLGVLVEEIGLLDIHDATLQILPDVEDAAAAEVLELHFPGEGLTGFVIVFSHRLEFLEGNLGVRIFDLLDDIEVLVDFAVSLVDVDDHVEIVGAAEGLGDLGDEYILEHTHHDRPVDMLLILENRKCGFEVNLFFCHWYFYLSVNQM